MSDLFLGVIAAAVLVMAIIQVVFVVVAARAATQVAALVARLEQDLRPLITNMQAISSDAARATALAAAQVERADRLFSGVAAQIEETMATVQGAVLGVTRGGAWLAGLKAVMGAVRDLRTPSRRRPAAVDEEDALFIG